MLEALFIHTISVVRQSNAGYSDLGEPILSSSSFVSSGQTSLRCRIETYNESREYRGSGERTKNVTLIYLPTDIVLKQDDIIYAGLLHTPELTTGQLIGIVDDVTPAVLGMSSAIDHYEIRIENP